MLYFPHEPLPLGRCGGLVYMVALLNWIIALGSIAAFAYVAYCRFREPGRLAYPNIAVGGAVGQILFALLLIFSDFGLISTKTNLTPFFAFAQIGLLIVMVFWVLALVTATRQKDWVWLGALAFSAFGIFVWVPGLGVLVYGIAGPRYLSAPIVPHATSR